MNVVLLSKALIVGAYQRKAELLAAEPDIQLTVIAPERWRDGAREERFEAVHTEGYRLVTTPVFRPGDFHLHFYPGLGRLLATIKPDIVHIDEEPYNLATWLAWRAARGVGARTLFFTWQNLARPYPPPFGWFERDVYAGVGGAIAGSHTAAQVLRAKGFAGRLWVVPQFGVDEAQFTPRPAPGDGKHETTSAHSAIRLTPADGTLSNPPSFTIGYAGRLIAAKGVDLLIDACSRLPEELSWRLVICGDGPERGRLEAQAKRFELGDRIMFRPWLDSMAMPGFFRSLDVLALPSRSTATWVEQFGRVLVEAMACGVPCVGAASGEIPFVLGEAGLTFPEGNVEALASCLERVLTDGTLRAQLGNAGRARVLANYTMASVATETARVYREIAIGEGSRAEGAS